MDFKKINFEERHEGINKSDLQYLINNLFSKVTDEERKKIIEEQTNPWPKNDPEHSKFEPIDPVNWIFPKYTLPKSYLELLQYSNGGYIINGERQISFFGSEDLREMMLAYEFPEYMPLSVPFGINGGGIFYVFDMRNKPKNGEFPILAASSGVLDYDESPLIASSLEELFEGTTDIEDYLD